MTRWLLGRSSVLCRVIAYLAALLVATPILYHLARGSLSYLGLFQDDYFYYSIVADRFVSLGRLTYDGSTLTNGFHPLWFLILAIARLVAGGLNGPFYVLLTAIFLASMAATYELSRAFAGSLGASASMAPAVALPFAVPADILACSGMETAVDIPLSLWLLVAVSETKTLTPARAARLGLIASLAVLARLDLGLLVVLLALGWLVFARPHVPEALRAAAAFAAGGFLVPVYLTLNLVVFGGLLPVSAAAKQLVKHPGFHPRYLLALAFFSSHGRMVGITLVLGVLATYALARRRVGARRAGARTPLVPPAPLLAAGAVLGFTAVFFCANAVSGWNPFPWYEYPFVPALVAALTAIGVWAAPRVPVPSRDRLSAALVAGALLVPAAEGGRYFVTHGPLWTVEDNGLLAMSIELSDRLRERQGVFAMGAIGGYVSYLLLPKSVVQVEGLVSDRKMVEHIRHEDDLGAVLHEYGVDYLIVSLFRLKSEPRDGCYAVTEPHEEWAGANTYKMRGEICAQPIVEIATRLPHREWSGFSELDTYVWDVRAAPWKPR
jgi:hypothetical protein